MGYISNAQTYSTAYYEPDNRAQKYRLCMMKCILSIKSDVCFY